MEFPAQDVVKVVPVICTMRALYGARRTLMMSPGSRGLNDLAISREHGFPIERISTVRVAEITTGRMVRV